MSKIRTILPVIALLLLPLPSPPQSVTVPAELIAYDSGMAAPWVLAMAQDRIGFMWFGTNLGVARHDGIHYRVFRRANTLPRPISNDYIYAIHEDAAGILWLGTGNGLNRFDPASETFSVFLHDPRDPGTLIGNGIGHLAPCSARPGSLWVSTSGSGLGLFDTRTGRCRAYTAEPGRPGALGNNNVRMTYEDSQQRVWVATESGLYRLRTESETFEPFRHDPKNVNTIGSDSVFEVFESRRLPGILWIGTGGSFLHRFDPDRRTWQRFRLPPAELPDPFSNSVYYITDYPDEPDVLLVGTRQGLYLFDTLRNSWRRLFLRDQFRDTGDPRSDYVLSVFRDRTGVCWICIRGRGLFKLMPQAGIFRLHVNPDASQNVERRKRIYGLAEDPEGNIWFGTNGAGLYRYAPASDSYAHFSLGPERPDRAPFDAVGMLCWTRRGELWAATLGGLVRFNPRTGEQEVFAARGNDPATLGFTGVAAIRGDARDDVWIASDHCLLRWDSRRRAFARYLHDPGDPGSLSASHVNPLMEDRDGNIWVGTENGLNLYDRDRDRFTRYYLDPPKAGGETQNYVLILHQDARGRIWVATSNGLNLMERARGAARFQHYSAPGSTLRNFILGIAEDDRENLWLSSAGGLSRFDMRTRTFSLYDSRDGVPPVELIYGSSLRAQSGEIYFGGMLGMFSFKPWLARFNRFVPPLAFTGIQVWRRPLAIGGGSPLTRSITLAPDLDLPYHQNSLTLSFAALSYVRPEKNQYAYRLDGRDDSWHDIGFDSSVNLDNLRPGRYRLRVRGSNNEGVWNTAGISLALRIRPPFWQTWWFRTLLTLAAIVLFVQWNRTRSRRLAARIKTEAAMEHYFDKYAISKREREIIQLLMKGKSNKEIEDALFISVGTVKNHIYSIFQKLGVNNRAQLIALFKSLPASGGPAAREAAPDRRA